MIEIFEYKKGDKVRLRPGILHSHLMKPDPVMERGRVYTVRAHAGGLVHLYEKWSDNPRNATLACRHDVLELVERPDDWITSVIVAKNAVDVLGTTAPLTSPMRFGKVQP